MTETLDFYHVVQHRATLSKLPKFWSKRLMQTHLLKKLNKLEDFTDTMIECPAGSFWMGSEKGVGYKDERPRHQVRITDPFWISRTPVTQGLYEAVMGINPSKFKEKDRPVEQVSWFEAVQFCNHLSTLDGLTPAYEIEDERKIIWNMEANGYRLLSDAEWEGSARAGFELKHTRNLPFEEIGWSLSNSNRHTQRVGQKESNYFGLYDLCGLVSEWVFDDYSTQYYGKQGPLRIDDPLYLESSSTFKVLRGGNWESSTDECHILARESARPTQVKSNIGFRVARTLLNIKGLSPSTLTISLDVNQLPQPT